MLLERTTLTAVLGSGGGLWEDVLTFRRERSGSVSITTTTDGTAFVGDTPTLPYEDGRVERFFAFLPAHEVGEPGLEWLHLSSRNSPLQDEKKSPPPSAG